MADIFYVDSGYVDSGYFVYTADALSSLSATASISVVAERIRPASASLNAVANLSVNGAVTRSASTTLNATANLSSLGGLSASGSASLVATASLSATVTATRGAASLPFAQATLSCRGNAIYGIGHPTDIPGAKGQVTGIHITTSTIATIFPAGNSLGLAPGSAISFWARKDEIGDNNGVIFNSSYRAAFPNLSGLTFELLSNSLDLRARYYADDNPVRELTLSWPTVTIDTEWHHYFLYVEVWTVTGFGRQYKVRLWQDGINQGTKEDTLPDSIRTGIQGPLNIGYEKTWNSSSDIFELTNANKIFKGCIAQIWIDDNVASNYDITNWYDNGYVSTLPSGQVYYSPLNYAYDADTNVFRVDGTTITPDSLTYEWLCNQAGVKFLSAVASLSAIGGQLKTFTANNNIIVTATLQADGDKNVIGVATLSAVASLSAQGSISAFRSASLSAQASLGVRGNYTAKGKSTLSAVATLNNSTTYAIFGSGSFLSSANIRIVTGNKATLNVTANLSIDPSYVYRPSVILSAQASLQSNAFVGKIGVADLFVTASLNALLEQVPRYDDYFTYKVEGDSRLFIVLEETRRLTASVEQALIRVLEESRRQQILNESRTTKISFASAIYAIECESRLNRALAENCRTSVLDVREWLGVKNFEGLTVPAGTLQVRDVITPVREETPLRIRRIPA